MPREENFSSEFRQNHNSPAMPAISLVGLSFYSGGSLVAGNISFEILGICSLIVAADDPAARCVCDFLARRDTSLEARGVVLVDGASMQASRLSLLLNQHRLFDSCEVVSDVLCTIDRGRASAVLEKFSDAFSSSPIGSLSIEESRIFEILLAIVAKPPLIFLSSIELHRETRKRCLGLLREHAADCAVLILSEYSAFFDGSVVIGSNQVLSLNRRESENFQVEMFLRRFDARNSEDGGTEDARDTGIACECSGAAPDGGRKYDFRGLYRRYKCENLVEIRGKTFSSFSRLFIFDIYRVHLRQSLQIAFRKYSLMIKQYHEKSGIYKNICPFFIFLFLLRVSHEIDLTEVIDDALNIAYLLFFSVVDVPRFRLVTFACLFFKYTIRDLFCTRVFHIVHNVLRRSYGYTEFQLISSFLYLSTFSSNASIFEEDYPYIAFYTNITMTPGTYVVSVIIYMVITHVVIFYIIGVLLNIEYIFATLLNAVAMSLFFMCFRTKRLREAMIGIFVTIYLSAFLTKPQEVHSHCASTLLYLLFPPITCQVHYFGSCSIIPVLLVSLLFYVCVFVFGCHRISRCDHSPL